MSQDFIDLNGWDTAYVVSVPVINKSIIEHRTSPDSFTLKTDIFDCQGQFSNWQIARGGNNKSIVFAIPITQIQGTVHKGQEIITEFCYHNLIAKVILVLKFVSNQDSKKSLTIDTETPPTVIQSLAHKSGESLSKPLDQAYIEQILIQWFAENLKDFEHIFAVIDITTNIPENEAWAFCKPAVVDYVYMNGINLEMSYLGILMTTAGNTKPGGTPSISPAFIPNGCNSSFIMSSTLFMKFFLINSIKSQFSSFNESDFQISTNGLSLSLLEGKTEKFKPITKDENTYYPELIELTAQIENSVITLFNRTSTVVLDEWYGTVTAYDDAQSWFALELGQSNNGKAILFRETQPSVDNHHLEKSFGLQIIVSLLGFIGLIITLIATLLTGGLALLVVGTIFTIAAGGIEVALADFEEAHQQDSPSIDLLIANVNAPIQWTNINDFELTFCGLNAGSFQLAGNVS